ncbi:hypothetical protein EDB84DRAFT_1680434 [Lactarius hengduanensis]|nr:hypothetical protein EDB84DRAFT_1680434 [Lactarius hengduanensis]
MNNQPESEHEAASTSIESTPASLSKPLELDDVKLESSPALAPSDVVTLSHPESSLSSLGETIPLLLAQHEASVTVPTPRHSTPPQRPPGFKTVGSDCSTLEVTPAPASLTTPSVPQPRESPLVYYEASLTLAHRFPLTSPPLTLSRSGLARFSFAFVFITTAALVSTLFNASTTLPTLAHKYWSKQEDIGNNRIGTFKTSNSRPAPHASYSTQEARLQVSRLLPARDDIRQCKTTTRGGCSTLDTNLPIPIPTDNLTVFDLGGGAFVLEPAHEDSATPDEDARCSLTGDGQDFDPPGGVRPAFGLSPKPLVFVSRSPRPCGLDSARSPLSPSHIMICGDFHYSWANRR